MLPRVIRRYEPLFEVLSLSELLRDWKQVETRRNDEFKIQVRRQWILLTAEYGDGPTPVLHSLKLQHPSQ